MYHKQNLNQPYFAKSPCGGFRGLVFFCLLSSVFSLTAQTRGIEKSAAVGVEYRVKAGIAIGGTSPLPLPAEIREIHSFKPGLNLSLEGEAVKLFNDSWGISLGLRLESRGMETDATVQGYRMMLQADGGQQISGYFWGRVRTDVNNAFLTMPVLAVWKPSERWGVKLGVYGSYVHRSSFSGLAYDGYLRENTPVGTQVIIDGNNGLYNFSDNMRSWLWGLQAGVEWRAFPHLIVGFDLTWGMNSIFGRDFETINFGMFPIYGMLSFGYAF